MFNLFLKLYLSESVTAKQTQFCISFRRRTSSEIVRGKESSFFNSYRCGDKSVIV